MVQRKLIQHGLSSLTLALPSKWLKRRGLEKGDVLEVTEEGNKLILSTDAALKVERVSVDVTKLDRTSILVYIQSLYRFGFNEIEVHFKKTTATHYRKGKDVPISATIHEIVNRLVGAEIIEQSKNRMLIKYITGETNEDFKIVLRRIFLLLKDAAESLLLGVKKNDAELIASVEEKHDNINKFVSYALRLLNKHGYPDVKKTCFYYHIIASLDKLTDILKYVARELLQNGVTCHKETKQLFSTVVDSVGLYYTFFYKQDLSLANTLNERREGVKVSLGKALSKVPARDVMLITEMKQILEILLDLTEFKMGLMQ